MGGEPMCRKLPPDTTSGRGAPAGQWGAPGQCHTLLTLSLGGDHSEPAAFAVTPCRRLESSVDRWSSSTLSSQSSRQYDGNARGQFSRQRAYSALQTTPASMMQGCFMCSILPVGSSIILVTDFRTLATRLQ